MSCKNSNRVMTARALQIRPSRYRHHFRRRLKKTTIFTLFTLSIFFLAIITNLTGSFLVNTVVAQDIEVHFESDNDNRNGDSKIVLDSSVSRTILETLLGRKPQPQLQPKKANSKTSTKIESSPKPRDNKQRDEMLWKIFASGKAEEHEVKTEETEKYLEEIRTIEQMIQLAFPQWKEKDKKSTLSDPTILKKPCADFSSKKCPILKMQGECEKRPEYMAVRCPLSCDLCNPLMKDQPYGVKQTRNITLYYQKTTVESKRILSKEKYSFHMSQRIDDHELHMRAYMSEVPFPIGFPNCKNRHDLCSYWALTGMCEIKMEGMKETCGPACHLCYGAPQQYSKEHGFSTPFLRGDLRGLFEAIEENRVLNGWMFNKSWKGKRGFVDLANLETLVYKPGRDERLMKQEEENNTLGDEPEEDGEYPIVIQFDSFLTDDECKYLLHLIKKEGLTYKPSDNEQVTKDGFGYPTTDASLLSDGKLHVMRTSSRSFVDPPTKSGRKPPKWESIIQKIELITGVPRTHMETPLQFDKFVQRQFFEAHSHSAHRTMVEEALRRTTEFTPVNSPTKDALESVMNHVIETIEGTDGDGDSVDTSSSMSAIPQVEATKQHKNQRVLGFTIFLSDVESGGAVHFPGLNDLTIKPKIGRAVMYPTVVGLVPHEIEMKDDHGNADYIWGLEEDLRTIMAHEVVGSGVKYVVSIYLRQSPVAPDDENQ